MFGTLKPQRCRLPLVERRDHERRYCGLCQSLGAHYGTALRGLLSHDAVFLALLAEGLQQDAAPHDRCRCPLVPVVHRPTVSPESAPMRYAAAYQLLLADQFLADRQADGRRLFGAARALLSGPVARARAELGALGLDPSPLEGFESRQLACERAERGERVDVADAARPTAEALALVLGHAADLPGADPRAASAEARAELGALGAALGEIIYLQDALEDLPKDSLAGAFNPCLTRGPGGRPAPDVRRVERACRALASALARARRSLAALPLRRHRALLESIVGGELARRSHDAMRTARAWASEAGRAHLAGRADARALRRLRERWLFALAFVTSWLAALVAFAQGKAGAGPRPPRRPPRPLGAGGQGGRAAEPLRAGASGQAGCGNAGGQAGAAGQAGCGGAPSQAGDAGQAGATGSDGRWFDEAGGGAGDGWLDPAGHAGWPSGASGAPPAPSPRGHGGGFDPCPCLPRWGRGPFPAPSGSAAPPPAPGAGGSGFGVPSPGAGGSGFDMPSLPAPAPQPAPQPGGGGGGLACPCDDCFKTCGGCTSSCTRPCEGCCSGPGPCTGCGDACAKPCRDCGGCDKCCSGCCTDAGCKSCCDPCQSCCSSGDCCKGCGDCGSCCRGCADAPADPSQLSDCCDKGPWA
ncbi:MAG TPA: DUF5685 family protein [Polyangiaceae bacterium]|nr:DUF5685 family protein [Polyangiaceae bacterium]